MSFITRVLQRAGLVRGGPAGGDVAPGDVPAETLAPPSGDGFGVRVTLDELVAQRRGSACDRQQELVAAAGLDATLDAVALASGLVPLPKGWSIDRLADEVAASELEGGALRQHLLELVVADELTPRDLVADAVARDAAVDRYEELVVAAVAESESELDAEAARLREQIAALKARLDGIPADQQHLRDTLERWRADKRAAEERWAQSLAALLARVDHDFTG